MVRLKAQAWADTPLRLCPQFTHCSHSGETSKLLFSKLAANNFPDPESLATAVKTYIDTGAPRSTVATRKPSSAFRHVASDGRERDGDRCRSRQQLQHLLAWPVRSKRGSAASARRAFHVKIMTGGTSSGHSARVFRPEAAHQASCMVSPLRLRPFCARVLSCAHLLECVPVLLFLNGRGIMWLGINRPRD